MENALNNLIEVLKKSDEYKTFVNAKEEISTDDMTASLIKEYCKLRIKLQAEKVSDSSDNSTEERMKKIMELLQENNAAMNYFIAEYKVQKMVSEICSSVMNASGLNLYE